MHVSLLDRLVSAGFLLAFGITAFFSFRHIIRFGRQVKRNRAAGLYDDPEFKRRIKRLNLWRIASVGAMLLEGVAAIWASQMGIAPQIWWAVFLIVFAPTAIWSWVVERRWRKLMTRGIE